MSDFFWFSDAQWARIGPLLPTDTRGMAMGSDWAAFADGYARHGAR